VHLAVDSDNAKTMRMGLKCSNHLVYVPQLSRTLASFHGFPGLENLNSMTLLDPCVPCTIKYGTNINVVHRE